MAVARSIIARIRCVDRRPNRAALVLVVAVAVVMNAGCASTRPLPTLSPSSPPQAWHQLRAIRESFRGASAYTRMRVDRGSIHRSFNARLNVGGDGAVLLDALTPLGTAAFTLYVNRGDVLFVNHLQRSSWSGTLAELNRTLPIFGGSDDASSLGFLLIGLPPSCPSAEVSGDGPQASVTCGNFVLQVEAAGLRSARTAAGDLSIDYTATAFPAQNVVVHSSSGSGGDVSIQYLEVNSRVKALVKPDVPADYTRGAPPSSLETGS